MLTQDEAAELKNLFWGEAIAVWSRMGQGPLIQVDPNAVCRHINRFTEGLVQHEELMTAPPRDEDSFKREYMCEPVERNG